MPLLLFLLLAGVLVLAWRSSGGRSVRRGILWLGKAALYTFALILILFLGGRLLMGVLAAAGV